MAANTLSGLTDFLDDDGFTSPPMRSTAHPEGHQYSIPSPDAETGLRLTALADIMLKQAKKVEVTEVDLRRLRLDGADEREFVAQCLSQPVVTQMTSDGVAWVHMKRLATYAFTFFAISQEAADEAVKNGLFAGKALPLNRAQKRASTGAKSAKPRASAGSKKPRKPQTA